MHSDYVEMSDVLEFADADGEEGLLVHVDRIDFDEDEYTREPIQIYAVMLLTLSGKAMGSGSKRAGRSHLSRQDRIKQRYGI